MSLTQLRTFVEVYRCRSLSEAGRALGLTQPAVSQHIASLETQLSMPLFERHTRGVRPTAVADDLSASIGNSLDLAEQALAMTRSRSLSLSGTVHIAAPSDYLSEHLASKLGPLVTAGLDLRFQMGGRDALYDLLLADRVHLGITASLPDDPRLAFQQVDEESLLAVATPRNAAFIENLGLQRWLSQTPYVAYDLDRPLIRNWLSHNNIVVEQLPSVTAPDLRVLRTMVCAGIGWSVLPDYLTQNQRENGTLVEIPAPVSNPQNKFYLVWVRSALRHPRVAYARDMVIAALKVLD